MTKITMTAKDLGAVFDAHVRAEFVDMDVAATMATMTAEAPFDRSLADKARSHAELTIAKGTMS